MSTNNQRVTATCTTSQKAKRGALGGACGKMLTRCRLGILEKQNAIFEARRVRFLTPELLDMAYPFLRRIAIFVDEPDPGQFYWVLIENGEDAATWSDLEAEQQSQSHGERRLMQAMRPC